MERQKKYFHQILNDLKPLAFFSQNQHSAAVQEYFKYYDIQYNDVVHEFGTFKHGEYTLAAHILIPRIYSSVVLLMHGYLDHTGLLSGTIKHLLSKGYIVAVYDMPGHGLSSGEPSDIDSFSTYTNILEEFIGILKKNYKIPINIIGHSTGGATIIDYMLSRNGAGIDKVILVAPLVRSYLWNVSRLSYAAMNRFVKRVPRVFRNTSSDKVFTKFNRHDPLQNWSVPLRWVKALMEWNKSIGRCKPSEKKILVLQGVDDTVVDWKYNMKWIKNRFPNSEIVYFMNGYHNLLNETEKIRSEVFEVIGVRSLQL